MNYPLESDQVELQNQQNDSADLNTRIRDADNAQVPTTVEKLERKLEQIRQTTLEKDAQELAESQNKTGDSAHQIRQPEQTSIAKPSENPKMPPKGPEPKEGSPSPGDIECRR